MTCVTVIECVPSLRCFVDEASLHLSIKNSYEVVVALWCAHQNQNKKMSTAHPSVSRPNNLQEIDLLKASMKASHDEEDRYKDPKWQCGGPLEMHRASVGGGTHSSVGLSRDAAAFKKVAELVCPLPLWQRLAAAQRAMSPTAAVKHDSHAEIVTVADDAQVMTPPHTVWTVEHTGNIVIRDAQSGGPLQIIRQLKGNVMPSALRHAPHCSVLPAIPSRITVLVNDDRAQRTCELERKLLTWLPDAKLETDFVWVGFQDGSIKLVSSRTTQGSSAKGKNQESDMFMVHELPKCHAAEVVAFELSPHHPSRSFSSRDLARSNVTSLGDAKRFIIESEMIPCDRNVGLMCSASADSSVVIWDLVQVYQEVAAQIRRQRELEVKTKTSQCLGAKGALAAPQRTNVEGCRRGVDPTYFDTVLVDSADVSTIISFCTSITVRPLVKLKGSVCGTRQLRWVSSIVTTEGYRRARSTVASSRDIGDVDDEDERRKLRSKQTLTRQDIREQQKRTLGLSEEEMADAEQEMDAHRHHLAPEPVVSKCVHLLIAGDSNGYVLIWNLAEELSKSTVQPVKTFAPPEISAVSLAQSSRMSACGRPPFWSSASMPCGAPSEYDARTLAAHTSATSRYVRSTDKRIQFSGGVSISGLEPLLPPVIRVTLRRAEPTQSQSSESYDMKYHFASPDKTPRREISMENEFMPLTDSLALYHTYENLEFFVGVDGSVQFLSCHPILVHQESEEDVYRLLSNTSPNRILTKRGVDDEVVGSLDYSSFSVYFSKRIIEYHSEPITAMRVDSKRSELWVARHDGMLACFSTRQLKILCRIPHPHARETIAPPPPEEVDAGLYDYQTLAGAPTHLEAHIESAEFGVKSFVGVLLPTDSTIGTRLLALTASHGELKKETTVSPGISSICVLSNLPQHIVPSLAAEAEISSRLVEAQSFRMKRAAEKVASKRDALLRRSVVDSRNECLDELQGRKGSEQATAVAFHKWVYYIIRRRREKHQRRIDVHEQTAAYEDARSTIAITNFVKTSTVQHRDELESIASKYHSLLSLRATAQYFRDWTRWAQFQRLLKLCPFLEDLTDRGVQRRRFLQWLAAANDRIALRKKRNLIEQSVAALKRRMELLHISQRMTAWRRYVQLYGSRRQLFIAHRSARFHARLTCAQGSVTVATYFHRWLSAVRIRRVSTTLSQSEGVLTKALTAQHRSRQVWKHEAIVTECENTRIAQLAVAVDNLIGEHYLQSSMLLSECFSASRVLELDTVSVSLTSLLADPSRDEECRVVLWTAVENLKCEIDKKRRNLAAFDYQEDWLLGVERYAQRSLREMSAEECPLEGLLSAVKEMIRERRSQEALAKVFDVPLLTRIRNDALRSFIEEQERAFPRDEGAEIRRTTSDCDAAATKLLKVIVTPLLETIAVFSSDGASSFIEEAWEAVGIAFDFLDALEEGNTEETDGFLDNSFSSIGLLSKSLSSSDVFSPFRQRDFGDDINTESQGGDGADYFSVIRLVEKEQNAKLATFVRVVKSLTAGRITQPV